MPKSFITLREDVKKWSADDDSKRIATTGYWQILLEGAKVEPAFADLYLRTLRDLGALLYVGDRDAIESDPNAKLKTAIFNPAWVKEPAYRVLWGQSGETDPAGCITSATMHAWLSGSERDRVRLTEPSERDDVLALMEACGLVFRFSWKKGVDGWLVPDHLLNRKHTPARQSWGDAETRATARAVFLPDYVLLPLIGYWRSWIEVLEATSHEQVVFRFYDGLTPGSDKPEGKDLGVEVLLQATASTSTLECSLRGGTREKREEALRAIRDELRRRTGLRIQWAVDHLDHGAAEDGRGQDEDGPELLAAFEHLRAQSRGYGLERPLRDDFTGQVRAIFRESAKLDGETQRALYRGLNVARILPKVYAEWEKPGKERLSLQYERVAKETSAVKTVLTGMANSKAIDAKFWEAMGAKEVPVASVDSVRRQYARAFDNVFPE